MERKSALQEEKEVFCTICERRRSSSLVQIEVEVSSTTQYHPCFQKQSGRSFPFFCNVTGLGRDRVEFKSQSFNLPAGLFSLYHAAPGGSSWKSLKSVEEAGRTFSGLCFKNHRSRRLMETGVTFLRDCVIVEDHLTSMSLSFLN